jgi:hypothetical protein
MSLGTFIFGTPSKSQQGSTSSGSSSSTGSSQSSSDQSIAFSDLFQKLFGGASAAAQGVDTGALSGQAAQLFSGGTQFLDQLQDNGDTQQTQLDALQSGLENLYNNTLNPGITDAAVGGGTLGGARQGVAQGVAEGQIAQQFQQGAATIMANNRTADINAAGVGLNSLPGLYSLALSGANAGLAPYLTLAQIMGGPTTLTSSQSTGSSSSESSDMSSGWGNASGAQEGAGDLIAKIISSIGSVMGG